MSFVPMKLTVVSTVVLSLSLISVSGFANQDIRCRQTNRDGSIKVKGIDLVLTMTSSQSGTARAKGMRDERLGSLDVMTVNQGTAVDGSKYTNIFLVPKNDDGMLDLQLQFDSLVIGQAFLKRPAKYVIASDNADPETGFAFGWDVSCSSRITK